MRRAVEAHQPSADWSAKAGRTASTETWCPSPSLVGRHPPREARVPHQIRRRHLPFSHELPYLLEGERTVALPTAAEVPRRVRIGRARCPGRRGTAGGTNRNPHLACPPPLGHAGPPDEGRRGKPSGSEQSLQLLSRNRSCFLSLRQVEPGFRRRRGGVRNRGGRRGSLCAGRYDRSQVPGLIVRVRDRRPPS